VDDLLSRLQRGIEERQAKRMTSPAKGPDGGATPTTAAADDTTTLTVDGRYDCICFNPPTPRRGCDDAGETGRNRTGDGGGPHVLTPESSDRYPAAAVLTPLPSS
jgi:hypothetical protein